MGIVEGVVEVWGMQGTILVRGGAGGCGWSPACLGWRGREGLVVG